MTQSPVTVTYSLEEVLTRLEQSINDRFASLEQNMNNRFASLENKIEALQKDVTEIKVELTEVKTNVQNMDKRLEKVENTQKNQIWTLITLLGGSLLTIAFRVFLSSTNI